MSAIPRPRGSRLPSLDAIADDLTLAASLTPQTRRTLTLRAITAIGALALPSAEVSTAEGERPRAAAPALAIPPTEEYLSIRDLAGRIPYDEQTIRNLMSRGVLRRDVHDFKPGGNGRPLFKWSAVRAWVEEKS